MDKRERQNRILDVLQRNRIDSQEQLLDLLAAEEVVTAQSTLSRDLREMAVVKGPEGYRVPPPGAAGSSRLQTIARDLGARVRSIDAGGTVVVLRAERTDDATALARRFDAGELPRVVAAVAYDRTVLVVTRSTTDAAELVREWRGATRLP